LINTFNIVDKILINNKEMFDEKNEFNMEKAEDKGNLL